ncbi:uncharacterized protein N7473_011004 [Penicillium subrubescens]|uniref:uncharacterized protein n=1 Tax=Penicillium subrubescens TaxID=1316194 RepID=UPI002544EE4D|nr:uncharacterized protein N7473_011004 [Penicillium subrubescens]KAJ5884118.1 hypothetical protein N7473_011004 [Penicillium subrubescens]
MGRILIGACSGIEHHEKSVETKVVPLYVLLAVAHNVVAAVGGSLLAHCYEAIDLYHGYVADMAVNGATVTLGQTCVTKTGGACTVQDFLKSIMDPYSAQMLEDLGELGHTTRPGDLLDLANAMANAGYDDYDCRRMFGDMIPHSKVIGTATNILINARDEHPSALDGDLLVQAKKALLYVEAEHGNQPIVEKTVYLDEELVTYQDIDWMETAKAVKLEGDQTWASIYEGYKDFATKMSRDPATSSDLAKYSHAI